MTSLDLVVMEGMPPTPTDWNLPTEWETFADDFVTVDDESQRVTDDKTARPRQSAGSACEECRRRKSRCNRKQPTCGACATAGTTCVFRKTCPPRGPKRGHLRALRDKIQALETRLSEQENHKAATAIMDTSLQITPRPASEHSSSSLIGANDSGSSIIISPQEHSTASSTDGSIVMNSMAPFLTEQPLWFTTHTTAATVQSPIPPALIQMGNNVMDSMSHPSMTPMLDFMPADHILSPLVRTDLDQLYFGRVHVFAPMVQKFRYLSWANSQHKGTQQQCLQFTMWALSSLLSTQFHSIRDYLYREARSRLDLLETDHSINGKRCIDQVQAWILLSLYEFLGDQHQRGLVSSGRALRLAQIMKLDDLDSVTTPLATPDAAENAASATYPWTTDASSAPSTNAWITTEGMRRTFWIAYSLDCFTAVHEGLSVSFGEQHIRTRLPAPNCKFIKGIPFHMPFLSEVMDTPDGKAGEDATAGTNSPLVRIIVIATICSRVLCHKQKAGYEQSGAGTLDDFIRRDAALTTLLVPRLESLTAEVAASAEHPDPLLIFAAMMTHMVALMLYEITKTMPMKNRKMHALLMEHKDRSLESVHKLAQLAEVAAQLNPFEVHLLSPIPLMAGARFCAANLPSGDPYSSPLSSMKKALHALQSVSSLARNCLQALG